MSSADTKSGPAISLRAGLNAGILTGSLAGLIDGLVVALGIDSSLFFIRLQHLGLWQALFGRPGPWDGILGLLGCLSAAIASYALIGALAGLGCALLLHPLIKARTLLQRYQLMMSLGLGVWFAGELFWWTRSIIYSGLSAKDPRRLAATAVIGVVGLALGFLAQRLSKRLPRRLRVASPFLLLGGLLVGSLFLLMESADSRSRGSINERNKDLPNVLLIVVDALRSDVIGAYGNERVKTPCMDKVALEGVLFESAFVQAPFTWTSFGSMLTGKYPRRHGLVKMAPGVRMMPNITLAQHLHQAKRKDGVQLTSEDFIGAAFMTGTMSHGSGLLEGFDYYYEAMVGHDLVNVHSQWSRFRSLLLPWLLKSKLAQAFDERMVATQTVRWLREHADRRFVAMVHYYPTHTPYDPPAEFRAMYCDPAYEGPFHKFAAEHRMAVEQGKYEVTDADRAQISNLYYAGASFADDMIKDVLDVLREKGVLDNTIVMITSDHGEELGDHGLWEHNHMYQTNLQVPMIVRYPKGLRPGTRVAAQVDSIDIVPTICDLMGLELPYDPGAGDRGLIDGRSMLPLVREVEGAQEPSAGQALRLRSFSFAENGLFRSIQDEKFKLIVRRAVLEEDDGSERALDGTHELPRFYALGGDPTEMQELLRGPAGETHKDMARLYHAALKEWSDTMPIDDYLLEISDRERETAGNLQALFDQLGYGGGVGADAEVDEEDKPNKQEGDGRDDE